MKMKKLIAAVCAALCLCFAGTAALAEDSAQNTYTIEDAELSFTFAPEGDWYVLMRDNLEDNDFLFDYGQDADDLLSSLESGNIYFDAFDYDITCELVISSVYVGYPRSMKTLHSMDLDEIVDQMLGLEDLQDAGVRMNDYRLETVGGQEYLRLDFTRNADMETVYGRQYTTVVGGRIFNFTMTSYTGDELDSAMKVVLSDVLLSVQYTGGADWVAVAVVAAIFAVLVVLIVLLAVRHSKKKRERQAAVSALYGGVPPMAPYGQPAQPYAPQPGVPSAPPMAPYGQPAQPYAPQPGVPSAPPMAPYGQPAQPYAPQQNVPPAPAAERSAEQQGEAEEHSGHCCACGSPLKPGSHFCDQCGMRND
ncbi:MAG: hypothetical protein PUC59_02950 [Firmicutes bacterium]|nr:hypothetical protein [Bacillota bacterium]